MGENVISDSQRWDCGEEVQKLISSVEDLRSLYSSLGNAPDVSRESTQLRDPAVAGKKEQLDGLLNASVFAAHEYKHGDRRFSEMAVENARVYLDSPWMHVPWLTVRVQTDLLDSILGPIKREVLLATCTFLFASGTCLVSHFEWRILKFPVVALVVGAVWGFLAERKRRALKHIRSEFVSKSYDAELVARRLQRLEKKGVPVPGALYALVRLGVGKQPREAR